MQIRMQASLETLGVEEGDTCRVDAYTRGAPPRRSLVCEATREVQPIVGMFYDKTYLVSTQVARLEWQREAAPP